jgi:hypothetical protein
MTIDRDALRADWGNLSSDARDLLDALDAETRRADAAEAKVERLIAWKAEASKALAQSGYDVNAFMAARIARETT